jgi:hypothetical protein
MAGSGLFADGILAIPERRRVRINEGLDLVLSRRVEGEAATIAGMKRTTLPQRAPATDTISYAG